ncbi:hypothetical protein SLS57_012062 [Botryosphaeria dothidea]
MDFAETLRKKLPIWKELYAPYGRSRYARHDNQDSVTNARRHQAADYGAWRNEQGLAAPSGAKTTTPTTSKALPPPARNTYRQPYNPSYYTAQPQPRDQPYFSQPRQQANQLPPQVPPKPKELSRNPAQTFHAEAEGPETLENTPEENPQAYYADVKAPENDDPLDDYKYFITPDSGCNITLIDRQFLLRERPGITLLDAPTSIGVRLVSNEIVQTSQYVMIDIFLPGTKMNRHGGSPNSFAPILDFKRRSFALGATGLVTPMKVEVRTRATLIDRPLKAV